MNNPKFIIPSGTFLILMPGFIYSIYLPMYVENLSDLTKEELDRLGVSTDLTVRGTPPLYIYNYYKYPKGGKK